MQRVPKPVIHFQESPAAEKVQEPVMVIGTCSQVVLIPQSDLDEFRSGVRHMLVVAAGFALCFGIYFLSC